MSIARQFVAMDDNKKLQRGIDNLKKEIVREVAKKRGKAGKAKAKASTSRSHARNTPEMEPAESLPTPTPALLRTKLVTPVTAVIPGALTPAPGPRTLTTTLPEPPGGITREEVSVLIETVDEQQQQIDALKATVEKLTRRLLDLEKAFDGLPLFSGRASELEIDEDKPEPKNPRRAQYMRAWRRKRRSA